MERVALDLCRTTRVGLDQESLATAAGRGIAVVGSKAVRRGVRLCSVVQGIHENEVEQAVT